ncbi:protein FAM246A [Mantella aurantiaca]
MTMHSTMGLLYTISEGSQSGSPSISPQSVRSNTTTYDMDQDLKAPQSGKQDDGKPLKNGGNYSKGKSHPRLAQLRGQIRAQIREHSPRNQMIELVDKVTYGQLVSKMPVEGLKRNGPQDGTKFCNCSSPACFASELESQLQFELNALRLEMKSSFESLRTELIQELQALHKEVRVCCHHCPSKDADFTQAAEKRAEWKSVFKKVSRKEGQAAQTPVKLDGQIKARSVPSLVPQSGPSRNQVLLRAMTTIAAKNALVSSLGVRSESDPVSQTAGKQSSKLGLKAEESPNHLHSNGNWGKKIANRTVAPLPQNGTLPTKAH